MKDRGYSDRDEADVSANPECTAKDVATAVPFAEAFPDLAAAARRARGPHKRPTKTLVSLRLSPDLLERFRSGGPGGQSRIDEALRKAAGL